jgi:hypothetical protein
VERRIFEFEPVFADAGGSRASHDALVRELGRNVDEEHDVGFDAGGGEPRLCL